MNLNVSLTMNKIEYAKQIFYTHLTQHRDTPNGSVVDALEHSSLVTGVRIETLANSLKLNLKTIQRNHKCVD